MQMRHQNPGSYSGSDQSSKMKIFGKETTARLDKVTTWCPAHLFAIGGKQKRGKFFKIALGVRLD